MDWRKSLRWLALWLERMMRSHRRVDGWRSLGRCGKVGTLKVGSRVIRELWPMISFAYQRRDMDSLGDRR